MDAFVLPEFYLPYPSRRNEHMEQARAHRARQFQRLAGTGLPALFEQHRLDGRAQAALRRQAALLRDYMAGVLAWHRATVRYGDTELRARYQGRTLAPAGLGTAAARAFIPS